MAHSFSAKISEKNWIIGIGASAGGLEALGLFVQSLESDFKPPVVIAQHLAPHAKSMMVELLSRQSKLPVVAAHDGERIEAGTIYITPPNFDVEIQEGTIRLTMAGEETRPKPSIDLFFRSLARSCGDHAVGIILSGTGSDGSEGIRSIRTSGGITLAQDDRSAKYDGMPRAAIETGSVDSILPPETIAKSLPEILNDHKARLKYRLIDDQNLQPILELVRGKLGTDFRDYKTSTIQRRIAKRMAHLGIETFKEFFNELQTKPREVDLLAQEMLVSVTSFFRDPEIFDELVPRLNELMAERKANSEVRAWVAGCATGEEAYTVAILLMEAAERQHKPMMIKVFATDLDHDAIFEGRNGLYSADSLQAVPEHLREKYFENRGNKFEVVKRLRDCVVFAKQDLIQNPPFVKVDLVTCRNVMIYFEPNLQKRILEIFHYALSSHGVLLLGKSEGIGTLTNYFETIDRSAKIYRKNNVPSRGQMPSRLSGHDRSLGGGLLRRTASGPSLAEQAYSKLFHTMGVGAVVVDEECNVLQILGDVSSYLGFFTNQVESKLPGLLPKNLGVEIPILIRRCRKENTEVKSRTHKLGSGKTLRSFCMYVQPLREAEVNVDYKPLFVVRFESKKIKGQAAAPEIQALDGDMPNRMSELEQELFVTREHLQTVIEELGISNEELQSLNEELSSTNEELQASSEELETTNEELQSTNEELTTLNEELGIKSSELKALNTSLENVQNSIGSALIVVDHKLNVIRYNVDALKFFNFSPADLGRPLTRVSAHCEIHDLEERLNSAIVSGTTSERIVETAYGIFQLRVLPSFDDNRSIIGAIATFLDNTGMIRAREKLSRSDRRLRAIVDSSDSLIFVKDTLGCYVLVNRAFGDFFGLKEDAILGKTDRELFGDLLAVQLRDGDLEVFVKRTATRRQETLPDGKGKTRTFLINRFPLAESEGANPYAVGTVAVDISNQISAQENLHRSETRYRSIIEDQAVLVCRHLVDGAMTFVNLPLAHFFGGNPTQYLERSFYDFVDPAERGRVKKDLSELSPERPVAQYEHRAAAKGGQPRWIRWSHRAVFDEQGTLTEYQAVGFDVTEIKLQTDHLLQTDALFSGIFNNTLDFLSVFRVVQDELVLESFNRSAERAFGLGSGQLMGKKLRELFDPLKNAMILQNYERCFQKKQTQVFEEELTTFGGSRYFLTTLVPIPNEHGVVDRLASISRDISAYKKIEMDLRSAKDAAEVASRSKSDFLASMSHELRTPLNVVLGMSQILRDTPMQSDQIGFVDSISRSGRVLLSLIDDVLDVAKIEAGKITLQDVSFSLESVLYEIVEAFSMQAENKGLKLVLDLAPDVKQHLMGDPIRLRQVLTNLVSNALKFTDQGQVVISVRSQESTPDIQCLSFSVTDTGIGIAEEHHGRLFHRFSQVDSGNSRRYGGSGLGLMISRQLVAMMNGEIGFNSVPGQGSTFWFTVRLPLAKHQFRRSRDVAALPERSSPAIEEPVKPLKILAVDDNPDSQTVLELLLKRLGHRSLLVGSGQEAIDALTKESYDLVLMDIQMPSMDGYQATAKIRLLENERGAIPVVALTANAMTGDAEKCFAAGMDDYLTKPIEIKNLAKLLNKWSARI